MKVLKVNNMHYRLFFDTAEATFIQKEAKDNDLTEIEMFEMIFGVLFIGGYLTIVGKERPNGVEG